MCTEKALAIFSSSGTSFRDKKTASDQKRLNQLSILDSIENSPLY
jgi:hypothetical protein